MAPTTNIIGQCDRCEAEILETDVAICFTDGDVDTYLCEPCVVEIKREWIDENRDTNIIESD